MNNFKNNHRRHRYKSNGERNFRKRSGNGHKTNGEFGNNLDFKRRNPGRNNQNASKLVEKYSELAREALSNGDKILSESYLQHAEHFSRILNSQEITNQAPTELTKNNEPKDEDYSSKESVKEETASS